MRKGLIRLYFIFVFLICSIGLFGINSNADEIKIIDTEYATYQENERLINQDLGYGIEHIKTTAISTAKRCNNDSNSINSPQVVNVLSVPSTKNVRVVNYTYPTSNGWSKQTLTKFVQYFEATNPGWVVIAGVNGDFYDWKAHDKALPYHTTGTTVSDGEVLRAIESKSIGYTNNGTTNSFMTTDAMTFTDYHVLTIYDENGEVIKTFNIDKINETPKADELAVLYTYRTNIHKDDDGIPDDYVQTNIDVPNTNSYIIERPQRCLPTDMPQIYAKGEISKINEATTLVFGQFAIVTDNQEIKNYLEIGRTIRVQKEVIGDMAACDQIMAVGSTLVQNGEVSTDNSDGMRQDRHPRTCIGVKEDGTLMFFVVDGRQQDNNMYGMTQDEQGAMMKYYDCYQGFNNDGGGSSTFGVRNENGEFVIMNSPSDGEERTNSNALLIVVPELKLNFSELEDDSVKLSYGNLSKGIEIENVMVTINGVTKEMKTNEFIFDGLTPNTICELNYSYDIIYNGVKASNVGKKQVFTTGKIPPKVENAIFDIVDDNVIIQHKITDVNSLASFGTINYNGGIDFIDDFSLEQTSITLSKFKDLNINISIDYTVGSNPNRNNRLIVDVLWFPSQLDLSNYYEAEKNSLDVIIDEVNHKLKTVSLEEQVGLISNAKEEMAKIKTKTVILNEYKETKKNQLLASLVNKKYNKKNQKLIDEIIEKTNNNIDNSDSLEEIDEIFQNAIGEINEIKTKGCNSNTSALLFALCSSLIAVKILLKKY